MSTRILFVCSQNKIRSKTAEEIFLGHDDVEAKSCGTETDASAPASVEILAWADVVVCMGASHKKKLRKKFWSIVDVKQVVILGIPDEYDYGDPSLAEILRRRMMAVLPELF